MSNFQLALRKVMAAPGPSAVTVITLAVAIAASTIVYSTVDVVWHAIPAASTDRLVFVASTDPRLSESQSGVSGGVAWTGVSTPDLADWTARTTTFEEFGGFRFGTATLTGVNAPLRVNTVRATANLLTMWGVAPVLGRGFRPEEGRPGAQAIALLTHRLWQREFSGDPAAVGRSVLLNDVPHTIVGVLRPETGTGVFRDIDLMVPLVLDPTRDARDERRTFTFGRLKPGVTREQASADLEAIVRQLQTEYPNTNSRTGVVVRPPLEMGGGNIRFLLFLLVLVAVFIIAMACANVSNIFLAQATARERELAIRSALGASRLHHVGRYMLESLIISLAAGVVGLALAWWGVAAIRWFAGMNTYGFSDLTINGRVALFAVITSFVVPLGFALVPALQSSQPDPTMLKDGPRTAGTPGHRLRQVLVAMQVCLAMVVMIQVGLFARTAWTFHTVENGFDPDGLLTFRVELPEARYAENARTVQFYQDLLSRVGTIPGVTSVSAIDRLPVADREFSVRPLVGGALAVPPEELPFAALATITEEYLRTMRVPLIRGRTLTTAEIADASPVALVSEEAARRLWPGRDPIGSQLTVNTQPVPSTGLTVVGIVGNVRNSDVDRGAVAQIYAPMSWYPQRSMAVVVRTANADPTQLTPAIRSRIAEIDATLPIFAVASMNQVLFDDLAGTTTLAVLLSVIAFVALCVAAAGIYGVVSYSVNQRRREIGIRMALGAYPGRVIRMMIVRAASPLAVGGMLGFASALALALAMGAAIEEVDARDPILYALVAGSLVSAALLATYIPARRAALVDPATTLRAE